MVSMSAFAFGLHLVAPVAEGVPQFDVNPTCSAAARSGAQLTPNKESCMRSELGARSQLVQRWGEFPASDRASCTGLATLGPSKSYVELLTCLEMARDARRIPAEPGMGNAVTGAPAAGQGRGGGR